MAINTLLRILTWLTTIVFTLDTLSVAAGNGSEWKALLFWMFEFDKIDGTLLDDTCWWLNTWLMNGLFPPMFEFCWMLLLLRCPPTSKFRACMNGMTVGTNSVEKTKKYWMSINHSVKMYRTK